MRTTRTANALRDWSGCSLSDCLVPHETVELRKRMIDQKWPFRSECTS